MNMEELKGKTILVTGGSRGIGAAVAKGFAKSGAKIAITYRSDKRSASECANEIRKLGSECLIVKSRVEKANEVRRTVRTVVKKFGRIDVLVNNAGIWKTGEIGKMTEEQWDETIDINLKGTFLYCNEVVPLMKKQKSGKIINISSTAGQRGELFHSHYAASKGGVIAFTKSIAVELAQYNINVNSVSPGWVITDMTERILADPSFRPEINKGIPRGDVATPEDVVGSVLFLASNLSNHIVGATINVNGGSVLF
jgi:3-oxoacyl-[acyl-carrier protein] reductase